MIQLVSYLSPDGPRTGLMYQGNVYPSGRYQSTSEVLADWENASARLLTLGDQLGQRTPIANPVLLAPLQKPGTIYFVGVNYRDHVDEMKARLGLPLEGDPKGKGWRPWFCTKAGGATVVGPNAVVDRPQGSKMLDWELELALVIGRPCRNANRAEAMAAIAGYTVANDLSAREFVSRKEVPDASPFKWDWIGQKTFDGSCPMGPAITPSAFVKDPMNLEMKLWVGDELMQHSNTGQMLFDVADQVQYLSSRITLLPGDVILTGTPSGVGMARQRFLQPGEVVRHWIEGIGEFQITIN